MYCMQLSLFAIKLSPICKLLHRHSNIVSAATEYQCGILFVR
jgi:hypothetical protein